LPSKPRWPYSGLETGWARESSIDRAIPKLPMTVHPQPTTTGGDMPKASNDRVAALMKDIETHAKKLRSDIRKKVAATGLPKRLQAGAKKLRKQVAAAAKQLDEHARRLRKDIQAATRKKPARRPKRRRAAAK
jgi:hypothetical protein